jgi:hypothetical protein
LPASLLFFSFFFFPALAVPWQESATATLTFFFPLRLCFFFFSAVAGVGNCNSQGTGTARLARHEAQFAGKAAVKQQ